MSEKHDPNFMWCQCDDCTVGRAEQHRQANIAVGRPNDGCACGACTRAKEIHLRRIHEGFAKITELENRLRAVRGLR